MKRTRPLAALALCVCLLLSCLPGASALQIHGYSEGFAQAEEDGKWGLVCS